MSFDYAGRLNDTINKYIRGQTPAILRRRVYLAKLQSMGLVTNEPGGLKMDWKVRYKRTKMVPYSDGDGVAFTRQNKRQTAQLPMRAFIVAMSFNKSDRMQNAGEQAIYKTIANAVEELIDDIRDQICEALTQIDGNAAGFTDQFHGLESMFAGAASTSNASGVGQFSTGQYAGLSLKLGNYGGSWTGTWPNGYGDAHYDFWTPVVIDYTNTSTAVSTATTKTWPNTGPEAVRFGILNAARNGADLDTAMFEKTLYRQLLDKETQAERLVVNRNQPEGITKLGFQGINIDGTDITWEHGIISGVGYGLSMKEFGELRSFQKQLFMSSSDNDLETLSDRFAIDCWGNQRYKTPRNQCKWMALGGS